MEPSRLFGVCTRLPTRVLWIDFSLRRPSKVTMFRIVNTPSLTHQSPKLIQRLDWMMFWLSSLPQFRQFRDFSVSTSGPSSEDGILEIDGNDNMDEALRRRTRPVRYHPSYTSNYWMWYKGKYITISRTKEEARWYSEKSTLEITSVCSVFIDCPIPEKLHAESSPVIVLS